MDISGIIESLFDANIDRIYRYFYIKLLSKEEAEDLTSETFLSFIQKVKTRNDIQNYESYLYGIARNVFNQFLRKRYIEMNVPLDENFHTEVKFVNNNSINLIIESFILKLPEKQAAIVRLRLLDKKPLNEICTILEKDMNYVKTTQKRAISTLKKLIACTPITTI